jgi:hypothetical protein
MPRAVRANEVLIKRYSRESACASFEEVWSPSTDLLHEYAAALFTFLRTDYAKSFRQL